MTARAWRPFTGLAAALKGKTVILAGGFWERGWLVRVLGPERRREIGRAAIVGERVKVREGERD